MGVRGEERFYWTDAAVEHVRARWAAGASASVIADELGVGKNAVVGKVHRLKLDARQPTVCKPARTRAQIDASRATATSVRHKAGPRDRGGWQIHRIKSKVPLPPSMMADLPADESPDAVRFLDREHGRCAWPINDVVPIAAHMSCGSPCDGDHSYCRRHRLVSTGKGAANVKPAPAPRQQPGGINFKRQGEDYRSKAWT